ncbi:hypothetical protein HN748_00340 [Candidatus Peregrinibacteria bacterium]|jgi:hypothetical protein|nr:hypothetical protein [Candidatus Peregrinibacteria bacterium]MBT7483321.1 hypothetical protein [Candidatus Peregrinibacteria bacterium]MBT7702661.1 hypothetical protein [Candidatus Peregrinibacteria bacterium]
MKKSLNIIYTFLTLTGGALVAHYLGLHTNFIFSAAIAGLIFAYLTPKYAIPAYCGAFVGMASLEILPNLQWLIVTSLLAALIKVFLGPKIPKVGGKAGFMAFLSIFIICLPSLKEKGIFNPSMLTIELIIGIIITAIIATKLTFLIRRKVKDHTKDNPKINAVVGSAIIGLLAGIPYIFFPQISMFSAVAYAASFAGMSSFHSFPKKHSIYLLGIIVGIIFICVTPFFQGFGGKLGTTAFISMMIYLKIFLKN